MVTKVEEIKELRKELKDLAIKLEDYYDRQEIITQLIMLIIKSDEE